MGFAHELKELAADVWQASHNHPFVQAISNGTLDDERFRFYLAQDYVFLIDYSRFLALAIAKAPELATMSRLAELLHATLNSEMALHRALCARFGLSAADLEATPAAPTTYAYTRHLLATAYGGDLGEIVAAILPCQWGYAEIGRDLLARGLPAQAPHLAEWIQTYAAEEFQALARWLVALQDQLGAEASPAQRARMQAAFLLSCRYEERFWEMCWRLERW